MDKPTWSPAADVTWEEAIDALNLFTMDSSKPKEDLFSDLTKGLGTLALIPTTRVTDKFDNVGIDPRHLVGKQISACSFNETELAFQFTDGSRVVLRQKDDISAGNVYLYQPKIIVDTALREVLKVYDVNNLSSGARRIREAAIGQRRAVDPRRANDIGYEYRVIGFLLDGMDDMGWIEWGAQQHHDGPSQTSWWDYVDLIVDGQIIP